MHLLLLLPLVVLLVAAAPAGAAFPGQNGRIAYSFNSPNEFEASALYAEDPDGTHKGAMSSSINSFTEGVSWSPDGKKVAYDDGCCTIYSVNDGDPNETIIDFSGYDDLNPAWSPDGSKIAFESDRGNCGGVACDFELWLMNPDGSGQIQITDNSAGDVSPAWSPDGTKIAFVSNRGPTGIWVMDPDGSDASFLAPGGSPNWSPDGSKLAFSKFAGSSPEIFVMNADGSNQTQLTSDSVNDTDPAWSPDGSKIVWVRGNWLYRMNAGGGAPAQIGAPEFGEESQSAPDWQPLPITYYARPKGATPTYISLVPAYTQCSSPNREHGTPLQAGSCSPPAQSSGELTVGTLDANGRRAKSVGFADIRVKVGNPATPADEADVRLALRITDVRKKADLSDYTGELAARPLLRITDKDNRPSPGGPGAATVEDTPFPFTVPCAATGNPTTGSTCAAQTSADAVLPGSIEEEKRAIWELRRFDLYDAGADGDAEATADNTLFATEGIFVP